MVNCINDIHHKDSIFNNQLWIMEKPSPSRSKSKKCK